MQNPNNREQQKLTDAQRQAELFRDNVRILNGHLQQLTQSQYQINTNSQTKVQQVTALEAQAQSTYKRAQDAFKQAETMMNKAQENYNTAQERSQKVRSAIDKNTMTQQQKLMSEINAKKREIAVAEAKELSAERAVTEYAKQLATAQQKMMDQMRKTSTPNKGANDNRAPSSRSRDTA